MNNNTYEILNSLKATTSVTNTLVSTLISDLVRTTNNRVKYEKDRTTWCVTFFGRLLAVRNTNVDGVYDLLTLLAKNDEFYLSLPSSSQRIIDLAVGNERALAVKQWEKDLMESQDVKRTKEALIDRWLPRVYTFLIERTVGVQPYYYDHDLEESRSLRSWFNSSSKEELKALIERESHRVNEWKMLLDFAGIPSKGDTWSSLNNWIEVMEANNFGWRSNLLTVITGMYN